MARGFLVDGWLGNARSVNERLSTYDTTRCCFEISFIRYLMTSSDHPNRHLVSGAYWWGLGDPKD